MRDSLYEVIQALRLRIGDPSIPSAAPVLSDGELAQVLEGQRVEVRYAPLDALPTNSPTGTQYLAFYPPAAYGGRVWEGGPTVCDSGWNVVTGYAFDPFSGRILFETSQTPPLLLSGNCYDLAAAAADALVRWAAKEKLSFDFQADGASYSRSQKVKNLLDLALEQRRQALPRVARTRV